MDIKKLKKLLKQAAFDYAVRIGRLVLNDPESDEIYVKGVIEVLKQLSERESKVLWERYYLKKTLKDVGKVFNVTQERIRQIEAKAIRRLRHPKRISEIKAVSLHTYNILARTISAEAEEKLSTKEQELRDYYEAQIKNGKTIYEIPIIAVADKPIEELDLSVRAYNCMRRASKKTIGDLITMTEVDFYKIRNCGEKVIREITSKLKDFDIQIDKEGL